MKKIILILFVLLSTVTTQNIQAQPPGPGLEGPPDGAPGKRMAERMAMFIERKMRLSEQERNQFIPAFLRYEKEYRDTLRSNRQDRLLLQQRLIELQVRYRKEFAPMVGDRRVIEIYDLQQYFIRTLRDLQQERRGGPINRRPPPPGRGLPPGHR